MSKSLIFDLDIPNHPWVKTSEYENICFTINNNKLYFRNVELPINLTKEYKEFEEDFWDLLDEEWFIFPINDDIFNNPSHKNIYTYLIYSMYKDNTYIGIAHIEFGGNKILCPTLDTESEIIEDLELMVKKLKGFTKLT